MNRTLECWAWLVYSTSLKLEVELELTLGGKSTISTTYCGLHRAFVVEIWTIHLLGPVVQYIHSKNQLDWKLIGV